MPLRALVLGGGNALGAYCAGAYQALHEAGEEPGWIAGSSIGAITAALIAGNPPERRVERLRAWWDGAQSPVWLPWARGEQWASAIETRLLGRPLLFQPRMPSITGDPQRLGLYDAGPMRRRLLELVDLDRLNAGPVRVSVLAVDLQTGEEVAFDTARAPLTVDHLLASAALIPDFPPVRIDGRWLVDGGMAANVPVDLVLAQPPEREMLCLVLDPLPLAAPLPGNWPMLSMRQTDLMFACQTQRTLRGLAAAARAWPADAPSVDVLRVAYAADPQETAMKSWDFSQAALQRRWQSGQQGVAAALRQYREAPPGGPGLHVHSPVRAEG